MKNYFSLLLLMFIYFFYVNGASAAPVACNASPSLPIVFNLSSIAVSKSLPVGNDIPGTVKTTNINGTCSNEIAKPFVSAGMPVIACYYGVGAEIPSMPGVYDTGVPGVGIAIRNSSGQRIEGGTSWKCDSRSTPLAYLDNSLNFNYSLSMALVKTSDVIYSGTLLVSNTLFGMGVFNTQAVIGNASGNTVAYSGNVIVRTPTCEVQNSEINVSLGKHFQSEFSGVGSTSRQNSFAINLICDKDANVNIRIDGVADSSDTSGASGVLALTKTDNSASGVGAQILRDNAPIALGQEIPINDSTSEGSLSIPFTARYYQTQENVKQGAADAVATFTMIYY